MAENEKPPNEWTVMFLFAGDNDLAPLLVSQVKTIREAGFHKSVDVLVHYDPSERGAPSRLLHLYHRDKKEDPSRTRIGIAGDSFVHNMSEDTIRPGSILGTGKGSQDMRKALEDGEVSSGGSLQTFLEYCRENHPAKNYMLFLFGHGLVVGNDAFLPDDNPRSGITLVELGTMLGDFTTALGDAGVLQLVALHSCAMSAAEVAYQLKGKARYMIGAEGTSYVGSMPYKNLLMKTFNALEDAEKTPRPRASDPDEVIREFVGKLFSHAMHNCTDYALAGYSLDLALCSLAPERYAPLTKDIKRLVAALKTALRCRDGDDLGREMILLAHWEAQSYWDENYTDLFDFCLCLSRRCNPLLATLDNCVKLLAAAGEGGGKAAEDLRQLPATAEVLREIEAASLAVMGRLKPENEDGLADWHGPVVLKSSSVGHKYQYSHGLSVYFPWSKPLADQPAPALPVVVQSQRRPPEATAASALERYRGYAFSDKDEFGEDSWLSFLELYFEKTQRKSRWEEDGLPKSETLSAVAAAVSHAFHLAALNKPTGEGGKPTAEGGSMCSCPSVKNYATDVILLPDRKKPGKKKKVEVRIFHATADAVRY